MGSLRFQITALVTVCFTAVIVVAALLFSSWFENQLVEEVRADDREELQRQLEVITAIQGLVEIQPDFVRPDEITNPDPTLVESFPLALIPDDGTLLTITNGAGVVIMDSDMSFAALVDGFIATNDGMTAEELDQAAERMPVFVELLRSELSPTVVNDFELEIQLLEASVGTTADLSTQDELLQTELNTMANGLFFGRGQRSATENGREIVTSETTTLIGLPLTITATSRVSSIDTALSQVNRTLRWVLPALALLVGLITWAATGRSLRPVTAITNRVDRIRSTHSGERVPVPATGDEISRLATTMNGMLDRLQASADGQRRFVSDASHELRTPAAVIRAEIEAGLADPDNDWQATANSVLTEQTRLSHLVDDLLLLARIDEASPHRHHDVDLDELLGLEATRGWMHPMATDKVLPVRVEGDARQLSRAIQNLVGNAQRHANSIVELSLHRESGWVTLRVDDDGEGVPAASRDRIFDRFSRLDEARVRDGGGAGLGLAIVKEVAEAHGGTAVVTNSPLGGARFELRLPLPSTEDLP